MVWSCGRSCPELNNMPRPQNQPKWPATPSGPYMMGRMWSVTPPALPNSWAASQQQFPPTPPNLGPSPTIPYSPAQQCPLTQPCSPTPPPSISPSQPRSTSTPQSRLASKSDKNEATRVYGFNLNEHWQPDRDHNDNQKINGLTLPRAIRQSAFTQKLDIEGCDPLSLPGAALLYQQANNHWLRKLAHGRELYLIPTGDIAVVVFATELLTQLRNRGIDLDRVSQTRARQDGKMLDKTSNTKHAILRNISKVGCQPGPRTRIPNMRSPISAITWLNFVNAWGDDSTDASTPPRPGQPSSTSQSTPIQRALMNNSTAPAPPTFDPSCLLTVPAASNSWVWLLVLSPNG